MIKFDCAKKEMKHNSPPMQVGQVWVARDKNGEAIRRIRILGKYPPKNKDEEKEQYWIYEDIPGGRMKLGYHIGLTPELNLRIVFRPEDG
jgi:hypothetical protein